MVADFSLGLSIFAGYVPGPVVQGSCANFVENSMREMSVEENSFVSGGLSPAIIWGMVVAGYAAADFIYQLGQAFGEGYSSTAN